MEYWINRLLEEQERLYQLSLQANTQALKRAYLKAYDDLQYEMSKLYDSLLASAVDGEIKPNDLYKFNRWYELQNSLNTKLNALGELEISIDIDNFTKLYNAINQATNGVLQQQGINFAFTTEERVQQVLDYIWCSDGKHFSNRIWKHKKELVKRINDSFFACIARGVPKDEIVKQLMKDFKVGFNQADRIVRTEMTYIQNQATADSYKNAGITKYKYLSAHDSRTSEECSSLDGIVFNFADMVVGENYPPLHANCRSTVTPYFD